jgi:predicted aminopeptidase
MSIDRKNNALARIAAALDRLDTLANTPISGTSDAESTAAELAALAERHAKLKEEATIALSALDAVIARASAGGRS